MLRTGLMCIDSNYNLRKWPWPFEREKSRTVRRTLTVTYQHYSCLVPKGLVIVKGPASCAL
jgi:hypothetical protein